MRSTLLAAASLAILFSLAAIAPAAEPTVQLLWPYGAPDAKGQTDNDKPSLTIYLPPADKATGAAVVICPGGGYEHLAMAKEGTDIAQWLNALGIAGFVLKYRLHSNGYQHPVEMHDAQRAMRGVVRANAKEWKVDPAKIGIFGFSAGGHLASTVGTHFDKGQMKPADPIDRESCRPDFMILAYPVISFTTAYTSKGSMENLIGKDADPKLAESLSNENQVTAETPPTFMFQTNEDTSVLPENSVLFYLALRRAKVPAELHIFEHGKHGVGLAQSIPGTSAWPELCANWLKGRGLAK